MKRTIHKMFVAHHRASDIHRCLLLPWGQTQIAVCARCLGFYPALLAAIVVQVLTKAMSLGTYDWLVVFIGQAPVLADWGVGRLSDRRGSNATRVLTGVVGGVALGRSFYLYFRETRNEIFWVNIFNLNSFDR